MHSFIYDYDIFNVCVRNVFRAKTYTYIDPIRSGIFEIMTSEFKYHITENCLIY